MQEPIFIEIFKFILLSLIIVGIAKYVLVGLLRKLAETLELKPRTVGNIAGIATSVPEFLTVSFSIATGLVSAGIFNIISSNIINLVQYVLSIITNKNVKILKNRAIEIDIIIVVLTIIMPILIIATKIQTKIFLVPIFGLLFVLFYFINKNVHKKFLKEAEREFEEEIEKEGKGLKGKKRKTAFYTVALLITAFILFIVGDKLSNNLENLCINFNIPQILIGVFLGLVTSIPELITFFESQKHHSKKENHESGVVEATNNLLLSNMMNLFIIQGLAILIFNLIN